MTLKEKFLQSVASLPIDEQKNRLVNIYDNCIALGNLDDAIAYCELLIFEYDWLGYAYELPDLYNETKNYDKTISFVNSYFINNPERHSLLIIEPIPLYYLGIANKNVGDIQSALTNFTTAYNISIDYIQKHPQAADIENKKLFVAVNLTYIGKIYYESKDYYKAYNNFTIAYDYAPYIDTFYYLGHMNFKGYGTVKNIENAISLLESIANLNDDSSSVICIAKANYDLGLIYSTENGYKDKEKAIQQLNRAKELGYSISDDEINSLTQNIINDVKTTDQTDANKSSGCYVATCVYGSYDCPQVWTLRRFRDNILAENFLGRLFIKFYYATSPTAVKLFGNQLWFHRMFKTPLDKLVKQLQKNGVENTPYNDK